MENKEIVIFAKALTDYFRLTIEERQKINNVTILGLYDSLSKAEKTAKPPKVKKPKGETWSSKIMRENPGSRWITYRGNHLLIQGAKDGKSARVVFSANPAFEHLTLKPKTESEYKDVKESVEKEKKSRGNRKTDVTPEELAQSKEVNKKRKVEASKSREKYLNKIFDSAKIDPKTREEITNKDVRKLESQVKKMTNPIDEKIAMDTETLVKALDMIKNEPDKGVKSRATKQLQKKASEELVDNTIREQLGIDTKKDNEILKTGNAKLDAVLKKVNLNKEQAFQIKAAQVEYKNELKQLKTVFEDEVIIKRGNVRITDMQGIGIESFDNEATIDEAIASSIKDVKNRQRAAMNTQFYSHLDGIGSGNNKHQSDGAANEVNAFAGMYLDGGHLSRDFMDFIGIENSGRIISSEIQKRDDWHKIKGKLEKLMSTKSGDLVKNTLEKTKDKFDRIQSYAEQRDEGVLAGRTGSINIARQYASIGKEIGQAAGSLQVSANILDHMRDDQSEMGDIVVDGGRNLANLKEKLSEFGLGGNDYFVKKKGGRYEVILPYEHFGDAISRSNVSKERDMVVHAIKSGKTAIKNFLPPGSSKTFFDTKTAAQIGNEGIGSGNWERFPNNKGEDGYTSHQKEGKTLYRKKVDGFAFQPHQQRMYEFTKHNKRTVWNAGAGSGKTIAMLGTIKSLKHEGELKNFAVITPPSRLVSEFFKDQEKFYPELRMVNLDAVKGLKNKQAVIDKAKAGEYDVVISGHDSIKLGGGKGALKIAANEATDAFIAEKLGGKTPTSVQRKKIFDNMKKEMAGNIGLPSMLANAKPGFVGIDEAHEAFKNVGKDTDRSSAIKTLSRGVEYFVPMTGTAIRNDVGELASILSVTRPDLVDDAEKFKRKWKNIGSQSTLMKNQTVNEFRREFDNIMITEHLDLKTKFEEKKNKISITPEQMEAYKQSEKQYRLDRDSKGHYGIMDIESRNLVMNKGGEDLVKFSPEETGFTMSNNETDNQGKQSQRIRKYLKANGHNPDKVHLKILGGTGASARRDSRHDLNLHAGDYKSNAKIQQILKDFEAEQGNGSKKQLVFFNRNESLNSLKAAFKEQGGLKDSEIAVLEGSMDGKKRKRQVNEFNTNPNVKVILSSKVGQTGLNMQSGNTIHWLSRNNTYAEQNQGNARAYRKGQEKDVKSFYNDSDTVLDNNKIDTIMKKQNLTEAIGDYNPNQNTLV